jgi:hypothetical protein
MRLINGTSLESFTGIIHSNNEMSLNERDNRIVTYYHFNEEKLDIVMVISKT